jgi:hypothetical protein
MSPEEPPTHESREAQEDWAVAQPEIIPRPTFWPAGLAFGITFLLWGLITSFVVSAVGLAVFIGSLAGWIGELRHEERRS